MNDEEDVPTTTAEIPLSLDLLSSVNRLTLWYMRIKGLGYIIVGLTWILMQTQSRLAGIEWLDLLGPTEVGGAWIAGGMIAIISSHVNNAKLRQFGWFLLIFVPLLLGFYFFISWAIYYLPFIDRVGSKSGITTTVSYWTFAVSAYVLSLIHNLTDDLTPPHAKEGE